MFRAAISGMEGSTKGPRRERRTFPSREGGGKETLRGAGRHLNLPGRVLTRENTPLHCRSGARFPASPPALPDSARRCRRFREIDEAVPRLRRRERQRALASRFSVEAGRSVSSLAGGGGGASAFWRSRATYSDLRDSNGRAAVHLHARWSPASFVTLPVRCGIFRLTTVVVLS